MLRDMIDALPLSSDAAESAEKRLLFGSTNAATLGGDDATCLLCSSTGSAFSTAGVGGRYLLAIGRRPSSSAARRLRERVSSDIVDSAPGETGDGGKTGPFRLCGTAGQ